MPKRTDSVSRFFPVPPSAVYAAFVDPKAMEYWLPPSNMTAAMLHFDFREGGSYRVRLTYKETEGGLGKTSHNTDEVDVSFIELVHERRIIQAVRFKSDDPELSGSMRMTWTFDAVENGTVVTIIA